MAEDKKTDVERAIDELLTDPDSPEKDGTVPPQTIDAEPSAQDTDAR